jgi:formate/nitrite transporter FocA (FNT family)
MGIFFTAAPAGAKELTPTAPSKARLVWGRVLAAGILLIVILGAGLYAGTVPALDAWNKALLHAFEVLLGLFVGVVGGEAASRS